MPQVEVVTMGEALALFLAEGGEPLGSAPSFRREVAGAELNVAVALARLGRTSSFVGRVGDDPFGAAIVARLRAEGVDIRSLTVDDAPTGMLARDFHGERPVHVVYGRNASAGARLRIGDLDLDRFEGARLLHLSGVTAALGDPARAAIEDAARAARERGIEVSFDPNYRSLLWTPEEARPVLLRLAGKADIVLAGELEAEMLSDLADPEAAALWFVGQGARLAAVKCGARGAWVADQRGARLVPPIRVAHPVDPVGAGDAFDAGFLCGLLEGEEIERCGQLGCALGACCVMAPGDLTGLPTRALLETMLDGGWGDQVVLR